MRWSQYPVNTTKETPNDAEVVSHQLMLRAGLIRKLTSGMYTWMTLGLRAMRKVENIVREEMNRACALEVLMPGVIPAEHRHQLVIDDFYNLLAGRHRAGDFGTHGALAHLFDKGADDFEADVGFDQRPADFAHGRIDIGGVERAASAKTIENFAKPVA